jgi:uncharacterized protein YbgA (DUF1722 family)/uncharacterized protein YbbK (DUF523 family)
LLGKKVRFDGGHKRDVFLVETFGRFVEWVPVCPEVEMGLGIPRETLRLVHDRGGNRLIMPKSGADHTEGMSRYALRRVTALEKENLCGYVLKKDSPSCGMERVRVYSPRGGAPSRTGRGLFAEALLAAYPQLPVEEEGRLCDPRLRENFVERVFAYRRVRSLFEQRWAIRDLVAFHTAHKFQLLAHSPKGYEKLGRLVAQAKSLPREEVPAQYEAEFMAALGVRATPARHANVIMHMLGFFKEQLDHDSRHELLSVTEDYRRRLIPLIVPLTLIRHHVNRHDVSYLRGQMYLDPHPKELMLRNHV